MVLYGAVPGSPGHAILGIGLPNSELSYPDVDQLAFRHHRLALLEYYELGFYPGRLDQPPDLRGSIHHRGLAVVSGGGCVGSGIHKFNPTEADTGRTER